jgi:hypothetical protein
VPGEGRTSAGGIVGRMRWPVELLRRGFSHGGAGLILLLMLLIWWVLVSKEALGLPISSVVIAIATLGIPGSACSSTCGSRSIDRRQRGQTSPFSNGLADIFNAGEIVQDKADLIGRSRGLDSRNEETLPGSRDGRNVVLVLVSTRIVPEIKMGKG